MLMNASRHMGDMETAVDLAVSRQLAQPDDGCFVDAHRELLRWNIKRNHMGWIDGSNWGDDELLLEPMGTHHLSDFAWQYYDPAIAERCCLPVFQNDIHWHRWLDGICGCGDQRINAVIHREWGFIGCVSLIQHEDIGFFYYWLGPNFQGQGFGPRAVALLLAAAGDRHGLRTCYAKVYDYNTPSRRALVKLGFEDIAVSAVAPDDKEIFYRRGQPATRQQIAVELHWLMNAIDSSTVPAIMLLPADGTTVSQHG